MTQETQDLLMDLWICVTVKGYKGLYRAVHKCKGM